MNLENLQLTLISSKIPYENGRLLLIMLEKKINELMFIHRRYQLNITKMETAVMPEKTELLTPIFLDVHLFFVCGDMVRKIFSEFNKVMTEENIKNISHQYSPFFQQIKERRDNLEHIDERILGLKNKKAFAAKQPGDLGNLINGSYSFWGNVSNPISVELETFKTFHNSLVAVLREQFS